MEFQAIAKRLQAERGDVVAIEPEASPQSTGPQSTGPQSAGTESYGSDPWLEVAADQLHRVMKTLRDDPTLAMDYLNSVTGVDYLETNPKKVAKTPWEPHLEVVYHLSSVRLKHRVVVKVMLPRWKDDKPGELPELPSVADLWRTADWHERELFDLFGVRFTGHPNLRRILCPEDWIGSPLRKDYEMPLEYHGIRGR